MMEQKNTPLWDWMEPTAPVSPPGDWADDENVSWEAAWIDIGGEG